MNAQQQIAVARQSAETLRAAISTMKVGSKKWMTANDELDALVSKISFLDAMIRNGHMK